MNNRKKLPIGVESFEAIRSDDFYYVDKTGLIKDLLQYGGVVNLFTRPRRFGKSLTMSMLKSFFELDNDKEIFTGLEIAEETELCAKYMGKFPVISISLKGMQASSYESARNMTVEIITEEARRLQYLLDSDFLTATDKETFLMLLQRDMSDAVLCQSLRSLSMLLQKHHGCRTVVLIDEYDVPLAKAFQNGYYEEMLTLIRTMLEQVLKTNDSLWLAVLTGCLRISKESIFTGLNNINVFTVADVEFDRYFGFTDKEIKELLEYYQLSEFFSVIKEWYDGYRFGNTEVYCPWDALCYTGKLRADREAEPQDYWSNTSSNDIIRQFIQKADIGTAKRELERLIAGEAITKEIHQDLTYQELYDSMENLWSILFTTGYLTQRGKSKEGSFQLVIPNLEIRRIFTKQVMEYFKDTVKQDGTTLELFCEALKNGDAEKVEKQFQNYLKKTISIRDTFVKKQMKENFYHGILLGLLGFKDNWVVSSNKETGDGYSDILIEIEEEEIGILIEVKYDEDGELAVACQKALEQIEKKRYEEQLYEDGIEKVLKYGVACFKKQCKVVCSVQ